MQLPAYMQKEVKPCFLLELVWFYRIFDVAMCKLNFPGILGEACFFCTVQLK